MDSDLRRQLLERVNEMLENDDTLPAVSVSDFFDGNTDEQSIGVNLPAHQHIGLAGFRQVLEDIESRDDVQGVFIELHEIPDLDEEDDDDLWPIGWVVFIVTSASVDEVTDWVETLHPRDISEGWNVGEDIQVPLPPESMHEGMQVVRVWLG